MRFLLEHSHKRKFADMKRITPYIHAIFMFIALKSGLGFTPRLLSRLHHPISRNINQRISLSNSLTNDASTFSLNKLLVPNNNKASQFLFVGGKGGVG